MESYNDKMGKYIQEILSENPFYISDLSAIKEALEDNFRESSFIKKPNPAKGLDLAKVFNYDTYSKMLESINKDIYYEKKLNQWMEGDENQVESTLPEINSKNAKDAFEESFLHLIENWHKFTPRSKNSDYIVQKSMKFSFSIFKAIYKHRPQLCVSVFPVVIFIIADSFYNFCEVVYNEKKRLLPIELNPQQEEKIYDLFHNIMTQDHKTYYLLSLLNSKGITYSESSFDVGNEIYELTLKEYKKLGDTCNSDEDDLSDPYDWSENDYFKAQIRLNVYDKLKKRFEDNLESKKKQRESRSTTKPTEIMVGENYLAFLNFLKTQPDNCWKEGVDKAASLYVINHITGWIALHLLYRTYPPADWDYGLSLFNLQHLHTLYFVYLEIDNVLYYDRHPHEYEQPNDELLDDVLLDDEADDKEFNQPCAWVRRLLSDAQKIYQIAFEEFFSDYNDNAMFTNNSSYLLDDLFIEECMEHWFKHDKLAEAFTYYTYNQYVNNITHV